MGNQINTEQNYSQANSVLQSEFFIFDIAQYSINELNEYYLQLQNICQGYNPFSEDKLSPQEIEILKELKLDQYLENPFTFTNKTLQRLDQLDNSLKNNH